MSLAAFIKRNVGSADVVNIGGVSPGQTPEYPGIRPEGK